MIPENIMRDGKALPVNVCPTCGYEMNAASCLDDDAARPSAGDFTLCFKCGEMFRFTDALTVRVVELNDLVGLNKEQGDLLTRAQTVIRRERYVG